MVICILYGRYCRHCLICRLLLYNNFKRGGNVTGQCLFNVPDVTLVPNFGRILVASLSNVNVASCYGAIIGILWIIEGGLLRIIEGRIVVRGLLKEIYRRLD